jgi:glycyl-tRNA synthetase beta subunit
LNKWQKHNFATYFFKENKMNKRQIIASLNDIANQLDNSNFYLEASTITKVMVKLAEEEKMKTKHSEEELEQAMSEQGIEKAFETYKEKGGSASKESYSSQWKSLIGRMIDGFSNNMGVAIAEEKYKRKNPFWDPRD